VNQVSKKAPQGGLKACLCDINHRDAFSVEIIGEIC